MSSSEMVDGAMAEGQQPEGGEPVAKSKNQLKNEAKKAEKMAKFMAKQANASATAEKTAAKPKTLNVVSAPVAEDKTVPGEKKGKRCGVFGLC
jgi:valyl-tRNA synthetase